MHERTSEGTNSSNPLEDIFEDATSGDYDINILDIELPDASNFQPAHWLDDRFDTLRSQSTIYEGRVRNGMKHGVGTLYEDNRLQYITGVWDNDRLIELHFAQFYLTHEDFYRVNGWDNLITSNKHNFVARITKKPFNILCERFPTIQKDVQSKISIFKILDDDLKNELNKCRETFETILESTQLSVTKSRIAQRDMFHLFLLMNKFKSHYSHEDENENINLLNKIATNEFCSETLKQGAKSACLIEETAFARNKKLPIMKLTEIEFSWKNVIRTRIEDSIRSIKLALINSLPSNNFIHSGHKDIIELTIQQVFTCSVYDIDLFNALEFTWKQYVKTLNQATHFNNFMNKYMLNLWKLLLKKIKENNLNTVPEYSVYTSTVFLHLFKSFLELSIEIYKIEGAEINIIKFNKNIDLELEEINEELDVPENRLEFLVSLMNHYKPGGLKMKNNQICKFNYKFSYFKVSQGFLSRIASFFDTTLNNIPDDHLIWLYYIHNSFSYLLTRDDNNNNRNELFNFLNSLMNLFIKVIKTDEVSLEKIRILANSVIKFGSTIVPLCLSTTSMNKNDMDLLLKQAEYMKNFITANEHAFNDISNIVDIYQVFWDEHNNLYSYLEEKYENAENKIEIIKNLDNFFLFVYTQKIYSSSFLTFLRSCNEFIRYFRGTNIEWYIKEEDCLSICTELVDENAKSYLVKNIPEFVTNYESTLPKNYLFSITENFTQCVETFFCRQDWNVNDKVQAATDLVLLMGRSFINCQKLPIAVDFQKFYEVLTHPFYSITKFSPDLSDFKQHLGNVENFYSYTMELNVMSVEKALELCQKNISSTNLPINFKFDRQLLESCYKIYIDKFNFYVDKYILQSNFNIKKLISKVKSKAEKIDISKWDSKFKQQKLPKLLAGLAAVWSAMASVHLKGNNEVMKPHCIQILCIFRLLGTDQSDSCFDNHLAQVLTGQGKSIILSLLAAILALTGNRVRIVCYNKYLADRDKNDFLSFYTNFNIENEIEYGTFDDMANEILSPKLQNHTYDLRKFVDDLMTGELPRLYVKEKDNTVSKTILLIDEVDVFFTPEFYGNTYNPCTTIGSEDLADLQIKIWNLTYTSTNETDLKEIMQKYIDEMYPQSKDNIFINLVQHSRAMLDNHVAEMISNAVSVRNSKPGDWYSKKYKLRDDGRLITVNENGEHKTTTYFRYKNAFMYFKLKQNNYDHKNFNNYGYINVACGKVSYAMLPKDYRKILGVTGTLKQLTDFEFRAVTSYNITRGSDMPTFFGSNRLRNNGVTIKETEDDWISAIMSSIMNIVEKERAVIVFFENEFIIEKLSNKFENHLSRYVVITGNESKEELKTCVVEAGIAKKVTIATRRMGRGVDFQSNDSAVESNGGVHVIQTFFSEDIKEETQIKGRTARKDKKGSYECILCRTHLKEAGYNSFIFSSSMNIEREKKAREKGNQLEKDITDSQKQHEATMTFLKSFFNYNPANRNQYFSSYPFVDI